MQIYLVEYLSVYGLDFPLCIWLKYDALATWTASTLTFEQSPVHDQQSNEFNLV